MCLGRTHIDGKTLRRSFALAGRKTPMHMVGVWTPKAELALAKLATGKGESEQNLRLWRSLKYECVYLHAPETGTEARAAPGRAGRRPHPAA